MATHRLLQGERFASRFVVDRLLGEGAMSHVYAVNELVDGAPVEPMRALKVLRPHIVEEHPKARERFAREARVGAQIGSDHVVHVVASGEHEGQPWLLMELVDGLTLDAFLNERHPDMRVRWHLLDQLFLTMAHAHHAGVIHRDLKTENIAVLDRDGYAFLKILDFGGAKSVKKDEGASLTESGLGTPLWAAPEQGSHRVRLTANCDVWALGLLTFFVFTSRMYWRNMNVPGSSAIDLAVEILRSPIEPASVRATWLGVEAWLPRGFDDWFQHCVNRSPAERFQNAGAARAALIALAQG